jgi:dipeptidyl aminopeptidase/acylaminoacyl peptidase
MLPRYFSVPAVLFHLISIAPGLPYQKPWTLDSIMDLSAVSDPEIAPGGTKAASVVSGVDPRNNEYSSRIWIANVDGTGAKGLAAWRGSDTHPRWSPDSRVRAFVSHRDGTVHVYAFTALDAPRRKVTNRRTGVLDFRWSPDGRMIGFLAAESDPQREARHKRGGDPIVARERYLTVRFT